MTWRHLRLLHLPNCQFTTSPNYRRATTFNYTPHHCQSAQRVQLTHQRHHPTTGHAHTTHNTTIFKFYIPLTVENYCFLTAGQDDDTTVNLSYTTATSEPATRFLQLHSLPGKLHQPAYDRRQLLHSAQLWHYYSLTDSTHPPTTSTTTFLSPCHFPQTTPTNYDETTTWATSCVTTLVTPLESKATAPFACPTTREPP